MINAGWYNTYWLVARFARTIDRGVIKIAIEVIDRAAPSSLSRHSLGANLGRTQSAPA
jgi:hypothetical protein